MNQFLHTLCFTVIFMPFFYCSGLNWQKSHQGIQYQPNHHYLFFFASVHLYIYAGSGFAQALPHSPFFFNFFLVTFLIFTCATTTHKRHVCQSSYLSPVLPPISLSSYHSNKFPLSFSLLSLSIRLSQICMLYQLSFSRFF